MKCVWFVVNSSKQACHTIEISMEKKRNQYFVNKIASLLRLLWCVCFGYFFYRLITIKTNISSTPFWMFSQTDETSSIWVLLLWLFGSFLFLLLVLFIIRFIYNVLIHALETMLPENLYPILASFVFLLLLIPCFYYTITIKKFGLDFYSQVNEVISAFKDSSSYWE